MNNKVKKIIIFSVAGICTFVILFCVFFFNKRNTIERIMKCDLPKSAEILEYTNVRRLIDGHMVAAKISIDKNDYESFCSNISEMYRKLDDKYIGKIDDDFIPEGSNDCINIEKYDDDCPWWDLEIDDIDFMFHIEKENRRLGVRHNSVRRIYVVETENNFLLYIYYWE